jgi:hypothetical protein
MPIRKEGKDSLNEIFPGLKAIKVTSRYRVNINRKMNSRFTTHKMVFGILYLRSMAGALQNL